MTKKETKNNTGELVEDFKKLSIQVSLNGLSFCVLNTVENSIVSAESVVFAKRLTPYEVLKRLKLLFSTHKIEQDQYSEVVVVHRNTLFSLVPKPLFNEEELANYLKFNTKILANDHLAYDELDSFDIINVYVPFVNINNYIYDLFGEFTFKHNGTVLVESLMNPHMASKEPTCYVLISEQQMDVTIISGKKLLLYNSFTFITKEDFLYYLLFTLEQLELDTESVFIKLFGQIEEGDDIYTLCYNYAKNVSIFFPSFSEHPHLNSKEETIDFTVINAF
ncbi:DUF3822 family protein [Zobellia galactanivorans]|uniref:DUF3822 family protein n=1 Tax=Zobellia galactanivorans (strain DSM 12802 / CCUG 47099 / CIP 106680 / NCIMB 13871 / Dsij) TaxID=63186 RepID=UPI001C0793FC|nr:DUF3822 family protein [Zobellia galactanivorans]MBU3027002.1 DUF3822 family protein [Zobellia galactanivorans]MDO6810264.1 DUF3822 family protein [Zobellia galactanivorans]